jgi:hypothetical protein
LASVPKALKPIPTKTAKNQRTFAVANSDINGTPCQLNDDEEKHYKSCTSNSMDNGGEIRGCQSKVNSAGDQRSIIDN